MKENSCTVPLACGDVARIEVMHDNGITRLAIYEHREDEPLIVADLTDKERQALIAALNEAKEPA